MNLSNIINFVVFASQFFYRGSASDDHYDWSLELDEEKPGLRIINGNEAKLGDLPYQISFKKWIHNVYASFCGGTLIHADVIISAAHCFKKSKLCDYFPSGNVEDNVVKKIWAVAGSIETLEHYTKDKENKGQWRRLKYAKYHKSYMFPKYDISVVKVKEKFNLNDNVDVIPMATVDMDYEGACVVSGFGMVAKKKLAMVLMYAEVEVVPEAVCSRYTGHSMRMFVCTSIEKSGTAKGDSGGPLVCKQTGDPADKGKGILVGVLNGQSNRLRRRERTITIFTRVSLYEKFVDEAANGANCNTCSSLIVFLCLIKISFYFHLNDFHF